jgi:hypothetical protein
MIKRAVDPADVAAGDDQSHDQYGKWRNVRDRWRQQLVEYGPWRP